MLSFTLYVGLAVFLGMCIGIERQWHQRMASLRTNTLVALGASVFMILAVRIGGDAEARIASYIVSGMGFLGAGVILKDGATVRGLNTAATLWCTAAIGAFCGLGYVYEPIIGTVFIIAVHLILRPLSIWMAKRVVLEGKDQDEFLYKLTISCKESVENQLRVLLVHYIGTNKNLLLKSLSSSDDEGSSSVNINAQIISISKQDQAMEEIVSYLTIEKDVTSVKWTIDQLRES